MSDAGKVLVATDGKPLSGASGGIVKADNLYPMVPYFGRNTSIDNDGEYCGFGFWYRKKEVLYGTGIPPDTKTFISDAVWDDLRDAIGTGISGFSLDVHKQQGDLTRVWGNRYISEGNDGYNLLVTQHVFQYKFHRIKGYQNYGDIEWARVAKVVCNWEMHPCTGWGEQALAVNFRLMVAYGDDATEPTAGGSNEPWDGVGWEQIAVESANPAPGSQNTWSYPFAKGTFEFPIPATVPSAESPFKVMVAVYEDGINLPAHDAEPTQFVDQDVKVWLGPARIVYNLA